LAIYANLAKPFAKNAKSQEFVAKNAIIWQKPIKSAFFSAKSRYRLCVSISTFVSQYNLTLNPSPTKRDFKLPSPSEKVGVRFNTQKI
jgi:hypothetical protein